MVGRLAAALTGFIFGWSSPLDTMSMRINEISDKTLNILTMIEEKIQKSNCALLEACKDSIEKSISYLTEMKLFGIENGVGKAVVATLIVGVVYYGLQKDEKK